ncbi:MAG: Peptide-methionine (R)-S-oxide reductase MsrB, partial [uncultured Quadrisphaera sp.]
GAAREPAAPRRCWTGHDRRAEHRPLPRDQDRRAVARAADPRGVPGAPPGRHRAGVEGRVHRHRDRGRLHLPGVLGGAVHLDREVPQQLRLALVLRPVGRRRRGADHRHVDGHEARRGALRHLRLPPRARLRGRGLPHPHRPALLHQLGLPPAAARPL